MTIIWNLLYTFIKIGLFSIGGGYAIIPLIKEQVVDQAGWISETMFTDIITISQMTPGPLAVNTSTFVGLQIGGIGGAVAATLGCVLCGVILSLLLYCFFQKHRQSTYIFEILNGLKSASLGLIISAAATILLLAFFGTSTLQATPRLNLPALVIFTIMLWLLRKHKTNPIAIMTISGIAGLLVYLPPA